MPRKDRRAIILAQLFQRHEIISINEMAHRLGVSERTIRYDLEAIDKYLAKEKLPKLIHQNNQVSAKSSVNDVNKLLCNFNSSCKLSLPANQRKYIILNELLGESDYIAINKLAERILFSRNTIIKDLELTREWLIHNKLQIKSAPKYGIIITGTEQCFRKAILRLIREAFNIEEYLELARYNFDLIETNIYPFVLYKPYFKDIDIRRLHGCIRLLEHKLNIAFSDVSYVNLVLCLAVMIRRIKMGKYINMRQEETAKYLHTQTFALISTELRKLQKNLPFVFNQDEQVFFMQYVLGSDVTANVNKEERINQMEIHVLLSNLIVNVGKALGEDLTGDKRLFDCLYQEIVPAIHRMKSDLTTRNPYLQDIKNNFGSLFEIIRRNSPIIEAYSGGSLSEDEIGYMTLHFATALEKLKVGKVIPKLLVVCGTGLGTANLLATKIEAQFNVEIVATSSLHDVSSLLKYRNVDLIVTTIPAQFGNVPSICVSPMLSSVDVSVLRAFFFDWNRSFSQQKQGISSPDSALIKPVFPATLEHEQTLGLIDVLPQDLMRLNMSVSNWEKAIECAGLILCEHDYIQISYIRAMIEMVKEHGPYIVFWRGVALPHATAADKVKRLGISFVRLKTPVDFGNLEHDPVDMIFALATPNDYCHIKALMELNNMLSNASILMRLRGSTSTKEVQGIIKDFLSNWQY